MMNRYLQKLHSEKLKEGHPHAPSKHSKPIAAIEPTTDATDNIRFEGFEGRYGSPFSEKHALEAMQKLHSENQKWAIGGHPQNIQNLYGRTMAVLSERCPDHINFADWQQAVADAERFLARWGEQAGALGWCSRDLFGLHTVPDTPHPSYRRLSRYDGDRAVSGCCRARASSR